MHSNFVSNLFSVVVVALLLFCDAAHAQSVVSAGYFPPPSFPVPVAPGQIITFYLTDYANNVNLPIEGTDQANAAGLAVYLTGITTQADCPNCFQRIIRVQRAPSSCAGCVPMTAVTIEIQNNLQPNFPGTPDYNAPILTFGQGVTDIAAGCASFGATCAVIPLNPVPDRIHILTSCDSLVTANPLSLCNPLVYHADWSPVTTANPGKPGEVLVLFVVGMGAWDPGSSSPSIPVTNVLVGYSQIDKATVLAPPF